MMSWGVGVGVDALIIWIDFPMPLKLIKRSRRTAASISLSVERYRMVQALAFRSGPAEAGAVRLR
jgi:hypothetical protein